MRTRNQRSACCLAFLLVAVAPLCIAKGITVQVSISGPGIRLPIHSSDPALIAANAWGGNFADAKAGAVQEPPRDLPRYQVHLWVDLGESGTQLKYTLLFVPDARSDRAWVQIPGAQDRWYKNNVYTIIRGNEGQWLNAEPKWAAAARRAIDAR
jgi:hypothetical protein